MVGTWRDFGKLFLLRGRRVVGRDASERVHEAAQAYVAAGDSKGELFEAKEKALRSQ